MSLDDRRAAGSSPAEAIILTARLGAEAGLDHAQLAAVMGGHLARLVERADPLDVPALGTVIEAVS